MLNLRRKLWAPTLALALAACGASSPQFAADPPALPGPPGAEPLPPPEGEPEELSGVDIEDLVRRERLTWWKLVSQLYAPCSDQAVSLAQCVREERPCPACIPGAQLIADKIKSGAAAADAQAAYAARFGPDVKPVDVAGSPSLGPENAPVTLVVWSDFECPACKRAMPYIEAAYENFSPNVRLVHKLYPLRAHLHGEPAARAAFAAQMQGKYWEMERLLFENQRALEDENLLSYARKLGLNLDRFRADMASEAATKAIARDREAGDRAGLQGTPHIVINGRAFDYSLFSIEVDLDRWIATEVKLSGTRPAPRVAAPAAPAPAPSAASPGGSGSAP